MVSQRLGIRELGRLAKTCTSMKAVVDQDAVWLYVFENVVVDIKRVPEAWLTSHSTWRDRAKAITCDISEMLQHPPRPSVFGYGVWRVIFAPGDIRTTDGEVHALGPRTFIVGIDGKPEVEVPTTSNGWFNISLGETDWTVWTRGYRSKDKVNRVFASWTLENCAGKEMPSISGVSVAWDGARPWSDGEHGHGMTTSATELKILLPAPSPADCVIFQRDSTADVTFRGIPLKDLPLK
mgnify:CR=1 FL=1